MDGIERNMQVNDITDLFDRAVRDGADTVVVKIKDSSGSTPRGAGAAMLIGKEGRIAGTIGGGAVELTSEEIALDVLKSGKSEEREFRLTEGISEGELGMLCGGNVTVSFIYVNADDQNSVKEGRDAIGAPEKERVWVFGAGHVAQALVPVLASVDFECIVLDDRPEFLDAVPLALESRLLDPEHIDQATQIRPEDYVVIMTHGHKNDQVIQSQVMRSPAKYIGVIGSERKTKALTKHLHEMGFTDKDFANVYAPIGVPIPSETPAEIAISIAAQMIAVRAGDEAAARGSGKATL